MNTLEMIKVSYDQLVAFGAERSYSPEVVKRFWGKKEELSLKELLEKEVHPHLITWTILHESILPSSVLHRIAFLMAESFVKEQRSHWKSDADGRMDALLATKEMWLNYEVNDRDLESAGREADIIVKMYVGLHNEKIASIAKVIRDLLTTDTEECLQKVYYGTIESANLTRDLVSKVNISEAWKSRLSLVKNSLEELGSSDIAAMQNKNYFSSNEHLQFQEMHARNAQRHVLAEMVQQGVLNTEEEGNELPVGTIIAYAAELRGNVPSGWLLCDGSYLKRNEYQELFKSIGTAWGKSGESDFNLPDLRGLFLRATGGNDTVNPERGERKCSNAGGNTGDKVGSYENYATCLPTTAFTGTITNSKVSATNYDAGCQDQAALYDTSGKLSVPVEISSGGGRETRPKNNAVHYLIKYTSIVDEQIVTIPLAAIFPYSGKSKTCNISYWHLCDGTVLSNVGANKDLFSVMGFVHGGKSEEQFLLPDYRNMFLRGVSGSDRNDFDMRKCPYEGGYPGNSVSVGSLQEDEAARPKNPFFISVTVPNGKRDKTVKGTIRDLYQYNDSSVSGVNLSQGGGDIETSPVFIYTNWIILTNWVPAKQFPVGAVIAYGGDQLISSDLWKLCDGTTLNKDEYPALHTILGEEGKAEFNLPDYRGFFLRGAEDDALLGQSQVKSTTKCPVESFRGEIPHLPVSAIGISGETRYIGASKDGSGEMSGYIGGDKESRPKNCAVNYYIRVLESK